MLPADASYIPLVLICLVFSAFFSGMEIAFISANRLKIELDKKQGTIAAKVLAPMVKSPARFIGTMLVGNNIALVVYGIGMAALLEPLISNVTNSEAAVLVIQTIISTLVILVTAEFLPKAVFRINPNRTLNIFAFPVALFYYLLYFIVGVTIWLSDLVLKAFFKEHNSESEEPVFGRVDLDHYVRQATSQQQALEEVEHEIQIFQNALDFAQIKARECMVPRTDLVAMDIEDTVNNLRDKFIETGFSKILIYRESIDNIIGFTHCYEIFKNPDSIKSILRPISIVPEAMAASEILEMFIKKQRSVAVVVDEFGGTSGMLTIEDIVEEIFGEIKDEHDQEEETEKQLNSNEYELSARLEIDYLNEKYQLSLPENEEYETLAGLILYENESIPEPGEKITIDDWIFTIKNVADNRIELVHLRVKEPEK